VAPIISMLFLNTCGMINLTAGVELLVGNPSFRPQFTVHWIISLIGGFGCYGAMFLISLAVTVVPALKKAGFEYRPPMQTRHSFATMMLSFGEDIGWVQHMLGHSSLQMIFTRYYSWIPRKTRNDGSAFMEAVKDNLKVNDPAKAEQKQGKVIGLFDKNDTKMTHPIKKVYT
jgi:hypothetical protein